MALPYGWRFERGKNERCKHCDGTGQVQAPDAMIAPSGLREVVTGFTAADARAYAEVWAPGKCSPERRLALYGPTELDQPQPTQEEQ